MPVPRAQVPHELGERCGLVMALELEADRHRNRLISVANPLVNISGGGSGSRAFLRRELSAVLTLMRPECRPKSRLRSLEWRVAFRWKSMIRSRFGSCCASGSMRLLKSRKGDGMRRAIIIRTPLRRDEW